MNGKRSATFRALMGIGALGTAACGRGEISVLTYNVAGLPEGLSASHPAHNTGRMSGLLNGHDVVVVQEDFAYHPALVKDLEYAYQAPPSDWSATALNQSGLARFSRLSFSSHQEIAWETCYGTTGDGSDCLTAKGFSVAEQEVPLGSATATIDIYNVHMDSGGAPGDADARLAQARQLAAFIVSRSGGKAVIVVGDTNVEAPDDAALNELAQRAGVADACLKLDCLEPHLIDRVLYRSSPLVTLSPLRWNILDKFVDEQGNPLSDHRPVEVDFAVSAGVLDEEGARYEAASSAPFPSATSPEGVTVANR